MVRTDRPPISTASTAPRSVSALSGIGRPCWFFAGFASLAVFALWWTAPIRWLVPIATTTAIVAAVVDWHTLRVPNLLTLVGFVSTLVVASPLVLSDALVAQHLVMGALLMAGPLLASHLVTRGRTPGLGDVKLGAVLGMTLGAVSVMTVYVALVGSLLVGSVFGLWYQRRAGTRGFPFAPAIAAATISVLFVAGAAERGVV
jgi:prepilin signal peptidase PulO-like enzyme (type II secretory pathway)